MKHLGLAVALVGGLLMGTLGVHAKLPPPPPKSDAEKAADAAKAAAAKAKAAELQEKYVQKAVDNYKRNKGMATAAPAGAAPAAMSGKK